MISDIYRQSPAARAPLRIALMLDGETATRCAAAVVQDISESNFAAVTLAILPGPEPASSPHVAEPAAPVRDHGADPQETVDISALLDGVPRVYATAPQRDNDLSFPPEQLASFAACGIDVVLRFGFHGVRLSAAFVSSARFGVWSYHVAGDPPFVQEMVDGRNTAEVELQALTTAHPDGLVLCRGIFPLRSRVSPVRSRLGPLWGSQYFALWKLNELHQHGWDFVAARAVERPPAEASNHRNLPRFAVTAKLAVNSARAAAGRLFAHSDTAQDWYIGLRAGHRPLTESSDPAITGFSWMRNPPGRFYADPCLYSHNGESWLFFEDMDLNAGFAGISAVRTDSVASREQVIPALSLPCHLSYPLVFQQDGEIFMIPESSAAGNVQLYRALRFPGEWKLEKILFEGLPMVDTTPLLHEGTWYFFTSVEEPVDNVNTALLFTAPSLTGRWRLHPASPISTDVRTSRSAGPILREGSRLLRPTQNCLRWYGYGFQFSEITRLNEREFSERRLASFGPDQLPGFHGTHTYHRLGDLEVIDAMRHVPRQTIRHRAR